MAPQERDELLKQIGEQVSPAVQPADVVSVRSRPTTRTRVRVLSDGSEQDEEVPVEPDISPLAKRMMSIVERDGRGLKTICPTRIAVEMLEDKLRRAADPTTLDAGTAEFADSPPLEEGR